ncbi:hypothetical protein Tco_1382580, partial [Tanacetum coccineum]
EDHVDPDVKDDGIKDEPMTSKQKCSSSRIVFYYWSMEYAFERLSFAAYRMRMHLHVICDAGPSVSWKVINSFLSDHRNHKRTENEDNDGLTDDELGCQTLTRPTRIESNFETKMDREEEKKMENFLILMGWICHKAYIRQHNRGHKRWNGNHKVDGRNPVNYSYGILLFEAITRRNPVNYGCPSEEMENGAIGMKKKYTRSGVRELQMACVLMFNLHMDFFCARLLYLMYIVVLFARIYLKEVILETLPFLDTGGLISPIHPKRSKG